MYVCMYVFECKKWWYVLWFRSSDICEHSEVRFLSSRNEYSWGSLLIYKHCGGWVICIEFDLSFSLVKIFLLGLRMPIDAVQILFLNLATSGMPAVSLCKEPADDGNMRAPPRPKTERIMTRAWWIYGNLPHCLFETLFVLVNLVLAFYMSTGVITLNHIQDQCLRVNDSPYYCQSYEYRQYAGYSGW